MSDPRLRRRATDPPDPVEDERPGDGPRALDGGAVRAFSCFVATQFLGAFNDNAFKQLILLLAVDLTQQEGGGSYQAMATGMFALPFVLFSGFAGSVADRFGKRRVIFWCKVAEIVVMALGLVGFWLRDMTFLLAVLFLMGTQSAMFGPAKYGMLPESLPRHFLSRANGIVLMTTFLAIILGQAVAGWLLDVLDALGVGKDGLHWPALLYVGLAGVGTWTALGIRNVPPARPELALRGRPFGDLGPTLRRIARDRTFLLVVAASSYFWFLGGVVQQTMNVYGRVLMGLSYTETSLLLVSLSAGMAAGALLGGLISGRRIEFRLASWGLAGIVVSLSALTVAHVSVVAAHLTLFVLGTSGSLFGLPLQTYIQQHPPAGEKGRVVAAANFVNWIFIFASAGYFYAARALLRTEADPRIQWLPATLAYLSLVFGLILIPRLRRIRDR